MLWVKSFHVVHWASAPQLGHFEPGLDRHTRARYCWFNVPIVLMPAVVLPAVVKPF